MWLPVLGLYAELDCLLMLPLNAAFQCRSFGGSQLATPTGWRPCTPTGPFRDTLFQQLTDAAAKCKPDLAEQVRLSRYNTVWSLSNNGFPSKVATVIVGPRSLGRMDSRTFGPNAETFVATLSYLGIVAFVQCQSQFWAQPEIGFVQFLVFCM